MPDSRRITGPHLLLPTQGAALELATGEDGDAILGRALATAARLGWRGDGGIRRHRTGATVWITAPPDQLTTATAVLDHAVGALSLEAVVAQRDAEANPRLRALLQLSPSFADEDHGYTHGLGCHSRTWPLDDLPDPDALPAARSLPMVFVTGTNGKTTTTRMLSHIARAAGHQPGFTSSDAWGVGDTVVESGDWTGPGAARHVLRHPEVDFACLETARGGLLRRGLVIGGAGAAVVTNVASDHLGEWGIHDVAEMATAKLAVAAGLAPGGVLVLNASNRWLREAAGRLRPDITVAWFGLDPGDGSLAAWRAGDMLHIGPQHIPVSEVPLTFDGTAEHNIENALAAGLAARAVGLPGDAIARGLATMKPSVHDSRGRMNRFRLPGGATALVDFGHNPDGVARVGAATARWGARRRLVLLGQAGDRSDEDLDALGRAVGTLRPHHVVIKRMEPYLRGRDAGDVERRLRAGLVEAGHPPEAIETAPSELEGATALLDRAEEGDLILLFVQADLDAVLALLDGRRATPV